MRINLEEAARLAGVGSLSAKARTELLKLCDTDGLIDKELFMGRLGLRRFRQQLDENMETAYLSEWMKDFK